MDMIRNSEVQTWKTCRHRWNWTWNAGMEPKTAPTALRFGDLVHRALAEYYVPGVERGPEPAETFARIYGEEASRLHHDHGFNVWSDETWADALELGTGMLEGYVKRFRDADAEWEVISSEQVFSAPLAPSSGRVEKIVGTFDGVWRNRSTNAVIFKEFKTATAITFDGLPLDEQAGTYWTYGPKWLRRRGLLQEGESVRYILYTFLRKAIPNKDKATDENGRYLNKDGSVSKSQPAPFFERVPVYRDAPDRLNMHNRILQVTDEISEARSRAGYPLYKNPGYLAHPNCRGCPVREACELHEAGGDYESVLEETMQPVDHYAAHRLPERY